MEWWQWLIVTGVPSISALVIAVLSARADSSRKDNTQLSKERACFEQSLQATIDGLRNRLLDAEKDVRECLADRAAMRQRLSDIEARNNK